MKGELSPIRGLVPAIAETGLEGRRIPNLRNLPHLQKVVVLTYFLLKSKEHAYGDTVNTISEEARKMGKPSFAIEKITPELASLWVNLNKRNRDNLPEAISGEIDKMEDPFGLDSEVTRATLEMANATFENIRAEESIDLAGDDSPPPLPTEYLDSVIIEMFEIGRIVGQHSATQFPAGSYYDRIFTPEASEQLRAILPRRKRSH